MTITRRKFFSLAAGAAAAHALPAPVLGMGVEPAGVPELFVEIRGGKNRMVTMVQTYLRHGGTQYRFTRYMSDSGTVLSEDVRALRPCEELTIARLSGSQTLFERPVKKARR